MNNENDEKEINEFFKKYKLCWYCSYPMSNPFIGITIRAKT